MRKVLFIFVLVLVMDVIFLFFGQTTAEGEENPPCIPNPQLSTYEYDIDRCNQFQVYKCANNECGRNGGAMLQGTMWYTCHVTVTCWSDGCGQGDCTSQTVITGGPFGPDSIGPYGEVPTYRRCLRPNEWSTSPPVPECSGSCYPAPNMKSLDDADLLPKNVSENSKYKLPINFGWDDNVEKEVSKPPSSCSVGSYKLNISDLPPKIVFGTQLQKLEDTFYKLECQMKSDTDYQWDVQACLDAGGIDCGGRPPSQKFKTSLAPELVAPYDPDWTGEEKQGSTSTPVLLNWCDVKEANSLLLRTYLIQGGEKVCHPNLLFKGECEGWVLRKQRRDTQQLDKILYSDFFDEDMYFFTGTTTYAWEIVTCLDENGQDCENHSQQWTFTTSESPPTETHLLTPPDDPEGKKPVGLPLTLDWQKELGTNSWWYKIGTKPDLGSIEPKFTDVSQSPLFDSPELSLQKFYYWQILSCWDYEGKKCKEKDGEDDWSEVYTFKTTGQAPALAYPAANTANIPFPINFDWEDVGGAKSYVLKVTGKSLSFEKPVDKSEFSMDYPEYPLSQETDYTWQVRTCAHDKGQVCGQYSAPQSFRTFRLPPPSNPSSPENNGMFFTDERFLSWDEVAGAKAYQYQIKYLALSDKETDETCSALVNKEIFEQPKTALTNSGSHELLCLGQYQWQVRSCLDESCQETSNWSGSWTFTFLEGGKGGGGLVPCGRSEDNPDTRFWNEREPCQVKHIFLLIKIIFDFLLLRAAPVILVLLGLVTGGMFYFSISTGGTHPIASVKSLWKAAGIGLGILFLAWIIVNIFLRVIGYNIGVFGNWYEF